MTTTNQTANEETQPRTTNGNHPAYIISFVSSRDNSPWLQIGAMWPTKSGKGFRITLDLVPHTHGHLVAMPYEPKAQS